MISNKLKGFSVDALLLAAGQGTRLKPVTDYVSKLMISFWGKPFLEYTIANLSQLNQIDRILIVVKYQQEQIRDYFGSEYQDKEIIYLEQENPKGGTADAISYAYDKIKDDFLAILGDVYLSKSELLRLIKETETRLAVTKISDPENHKIVNFTEDRLVTGFGNQGQWADLGFYRLTPEFFDKIKKARPILKNEEELKILPVIDIFLDQLKPKVVFSKQPWVQIGDHQEVDGVIKAKDFLYSGSQKPIPSSIDCSTKNCQIKDSLVFGPGKLEECKIKKSLVYIRTQAQNRNTSNQIAVL